MAEGRITTEAVFGTPAQRATTERQMYQIRIAELEALLEVSQTALRREIDGRRRAEEMAYEHGLGDRVKVHHDNLVLANAVAGLVNYHHPIRVPA